jgi:hypothetical protein
VTLPRVFHDILYFAGSPHLPQSVPSKVLVLCDIYLYTTLYTHLRNQCKRGYFFSVPRIVSEETLFHGPYNIYSYLFIKKVIPCDFISPPLVYTYIRTQCKRGKISNKSPRYLKRNPMWWAPHHLPLDFHGKW